MSRHRPTQYRGRCLCCGTKNYMNGMCGDCAARLIGCGQSMHKNYRSGAVVRCGCRYQVLIVEIDGETGERTERLWRTCDREQEAERVARTVKG